MQIEEHFLHRHVQIWTWRCFLQEVPHTRLRVRVQVSFPRHPKTFPMTFSVELWGKCYACLPRLLHFAL